ncbi:MAG: GNAT family N-acetyltransferase [Chitinophagales bacterium]
MQINIRRATISDLDFIVESIVSAEKSNTDRLSYCTVFELEESAFCTILRQILEEDIPGQELALSSFLIAESDGEHAGAVAAWVEDETQPGSFVKGGLLSHFLPEDSVLKANSKSVLLDAVSIKRDPGAIQIESVYVRGKFRGNSIAGMLINSHIDQLRYGRPDIQKVQVILSGNNMSALKSYEKEGFRVIYTKSSDNLKLLNLLPSASKLLMEKQLN